jgi:hypothetical protein
MREAEDEGMTLAVARLYLTNRGGRPPAWHFMIGTTDDCAPIRHAGTPAPLRKFDWHPRNFGWRQRRVNRQRREGNKSEDSAGATVHHPAGVAKLL